MSKMTDREWAVSIGIPVVPEPTGRGINARKVRLPWLDNLQPKDVPWEMTMRHVEDHSPQLPGLPVSTGSRIRDGYLDSRTKYPDDMASRERNEVAAQIRRRRKREKLTQAQLADMFQISLSMIKKIENGLRKAPGDLAAWGQKAKRTQSNALGTTLVSFSPLRAA